VTAGLRTGLRLRIAASIVAIVLLAVVGLAIAVHLLVTLDRVDEARASAQARISAAVQIYERTGLLSFDAKVDDRSVPHELRAAVRRDGARATLVRGGSTRDVWAAGRTGDTVLSTHTRLRVADASVRAVDRALVLAGLVTLVVATLVGFASANRLARRLQLAARTAREVAGGADPRSLRAAVGTRRDEVGDLADAVDVMTERLNARLVSEQRFTADVAHDLRTPVTGLVTAAALLDDSRPSELVRDRAAVLAHLVEDLLEVARLDRGSETAAEELVDLGECVRHAVDVGIASGEYGEDTLVVRTDDTTQVLTDPRRLERVLSNLVRNAHLHGAPPVVVTQEGTRITVRDHGGGFDAGMLTRGPERFRQSRPHRADGNGLGLVIAAGQVAVLGGSLSFANAPSGGALVRVTLPSEPDATSQPGHNPVTEA
jgi:two-component system, OmpR family, sensor histidine kinase MtrB